MNEADLKSLLRYCPETGEFRWLVRRNGRNGGVKPGDLAGKKMKIGYVSVGVLRKEVLAHRLAFFFMKGSFPQGDVDHINGDKADNRWANLRDVSHSLNLHNRKSPPKGNTSGVMGVRRRDGKWSAELCVDGKVYRLGRYSTAQDAETAYKAAKRILVSYG